MHYSADNEKRLEVHRRERVAMRPRAARLANLISLRAKLVTPGLLAETAQAQGKMRRKVSGLLFHRRGIRSMRVRCELRRETRRSGPRGVPATSFFSDLEKCAILNSLRIKCCPRIVHFSGKNKRQRPGLDLPTTKVVIVSTGAPMKTLAYQFSVKSPWHEKTSRARQTGQLHNLFIKRISKL
jgi:hypothetical protein